MSKMTDDELAERIIAALVKYPPGTTFGCMTLARAAGTVGTTRSKSGELRVRERVYTVMPTVVRVFAERYPDARISVDRSGPWGTYRVVTDVDDYTLRAELARAKAGVSKLQRAHVTTEIATTPAGRMLHVLTGMAGQLDNGLDVIADMLPAADAIPVQQP